MEQESGGEAEVVLPASEAPGLIVSNILSFVFLLGDRDEVNPTPGMSLQVKSLTDYDAKTLATGRKLVGLLAKLGADVPMERAGAAMTAKLGNTIAFGPDAVRPYLPLAEGDQILLGEIGIVRGQRQGPSAIIKAFPHKRETVDVTVQWFLATIEKVTRIEL